MINTVQLFHHILTPLSTDLSERIGLEWRRKITEALQKQYLQRHMAHELSMDGRVDR
jgi:hypothetical protein